MATTKSIYDRLRDAQHELKAPKSEQGRFGKSRSAEMIVEAAKPVLKDHGLTLVMTDELMYVGERHYIKATASVYDDEGNAVTASAYAWEGGVDRGLDPSQVTGKTSSYARKYALGGLLAIDDTKDADSKDYPAASEPARKPAVGSAPRQTTADAATEVQKRQIKAHLVGIHVPTHEMTAFLEDNFGITPGSTMTRVDAANILKELRSWREDGEPAEEAA